MDFVYLLIGGEWEDIVVYLSKEDAIEVSKKYPNYRVEIFGKNMEDSTDSGFIPTYGYYKNGEYNSSMMQIHR